MLKQVLSAVAKKETKSGKYGTTGSYLKMTFSINGSRLYLYDLRIPGAAGMGLDINSTWRQVISIEYQPPYALVVVYQTNVVSGSAVAMGVQGTL